MPGGRASVGPCWQPATPAVPSCLSPVFARHPAQVNSPAVKPEPKKRSKPEPKKTLAAKVCRLGREPGAEVVYGSSASPGWQCPPSIPTHLLDLPVHSLSRPPSPPTNPQAMANTSKPSGSGSYDFDLANEEAASPVPAPKAKVCARVCVCVRVRTLGGEQRLGMGPGWHRGG